LRIGWHFQPRRQRAQVRSQRQGGRACLLAVLGLLCDDFELRGQGGAIDRRVS
jgi:hypothetical protein